MLNNNRKNSICADTECLIAYLYGESDAAEKAEFEAHLDTCAACVEELAEFNFARTAVSEWRSLEFDNLATPVFGIPVNEAKSFTTLEKPRSRFAEWKQLFAFRPALAMSALAVAVILFGAAFIIFNLKDNREVAQENTVNKTVKAAVSPTISEVETAPIGGRETVDKFAAPPEQTAVKVVDKKPSASRSSAVKTSVNAPLKNDSADVVPVRTIQNTGRVGQKSTGAANASKSELPRLTDAEEEVDNSVRLADLFDEIGTR
ncbi:MAG: zf-HC2 domain-containing protein [Acidobacteriota bacterium]|nr:zf-HC2 domain-containing protein [Acidobacteriota bacterium]